MHVHNQSHSRVASIGFVIAKSQHPCLLTEAKFSYDSITVTWKDKIKERLLALSTFCRLWHRIEMRCVDDALDKSRRDNYWAQLASINSAFLSAIFLETKKMRDKKTQITFCGQAETLRVKIQAQGTPWWKEWTITAARLIRKAPRPSTTAFHLSRDH